MPTSEDLVQLHLDTSPAVRDGVYGHEVGDPLRLYEARGRTGPAEPLDGRFRISDYLAQERGKDLLRFSTAGSVDDGKSTLIGRLLYDTQSVYEDQVRSIEGKGTTAPGVLDLALLTDGLRAEREQGITIDVAYRYFSTARRKFVIADTPGHVQYTRNMATGASTADVAILLVDARKGVLVQSRRHAYIASLLGVRHLIVAINKMDLVDWSKSTFQSIVEEFKAFFSSLQVEGSERTQLHFVPVSALAGDNVVHPSTAMRWYTGRTLLGLLESVPASITTDAPFRMAVQRVSRPNLDFRGFAGQIAAGTIRVGDAISVLPSRRQSRVRRIVTFDGDLTEAAAPLSITLTLEDEIDISRGDLIASLDRPPAVTSDLTASMVWMDASPLDPGRRYLLKHASRTVQAQVVQVLSTYDLEVRVGSQQAATEQTLHLNGIGQVTVHTLQPLALDRYTSNRSTGSFVLIDPETNATVAAGMVTRVSAHPADRSAALLPQGPVTPQERASRYGHRATHLQVSGDAAFVDALERALFQVGAVVVRVSQATPELLTVLRNSGVLLLVMAPAQEDASALTIDGGPPHRIASVALSDAVQEAVHLLRTEGVLLGKALP